MSREEDVIADARRCAADWNSADRPHAPREINGEELSLYGIATWQAEFDRALAEQQND